MRKLTFLSAVLAVTAGAALADGMAQVSPTTTLIAPASDWSGAYVGLSAGTGQAENKGTNAEVDLNTYGVFAGYNYDMGQYVIGAEVSYDQIDIEGCRSCDDRVMRVMARIGYDAGRALPYLTAGFASLDLENGGNDNGFAYGVGADFKVTDRIVVGAQYIQHDFNDFNDTGNDLKAGVFSLRAAYRF
ncbi:MAG: hypothetical protein CSA72_09815 [Rhodobacterales bacterium]|nr:MAG: hypothetical protein CSA72_09815 [Rhodobacterales bacterium]